MVFTLVIDAREAAVKKELDKGGAVYISEQLDVGDMIIKSDDRFVAVFERKTYADLDSSIISKRHQQQRQRLKEFKQAHSCKIVYILEGRVLDNSRVRGAVENLVFKHGFCVIPTASSKHTADLLISLVKKYTCGDIVIDNEGSDVGPAEAQAGLYSKKSKIAESVFYHQLLVVPQVGEKLAQSLADEFECAGRFVEFLNEQEAVCNLGEKKVGARRIGSKTAQRISDAFKIGKVNVG